MAPEPTCSEPNGILEHGKCVHATSGMGIYDFYNFNNPIVADNSGGVCYGMVSTATLYFRHYGKLQANYPYYPMPTISRIRYARQPYDIENGMNNIYFAIIFHQLFDLDMKFEETFGKINTPLEGFYHIEFSLEAGNPVVVELADKYGLTHAVLAYKLTFYEDRDRIYIYNPNDPNKLSYIDFDLSKENFTFNSDLEGSEVVHIFEPKPIQWTWFSILSWTLPQDATFIDKEGRFKKYRIYEKYLRDYMVITSDDNIKIVDKLGNTAQITEVGNSQTFTTNIPGAVGISEGNIRAFGLPKSGEYWLDPYSDNNSFIFAYWLENNSNVISEHSYYADILGNETHYYTAEPQNDFLLIKVNGSDVALNMIVTYADSQGNVSVRNLTNISLEAGSALNLSVLNWTNLSQAEKGLAVSIDSDGDGVFEQEVELAQKTNIYYEGDFSGTYSDYTTLSAKLLLENGTGLSNKNISFEMANQTINATTDENGTASVILSLNFLPGNYSLNLTFAGDNEHLYSINSTVFEVKKELSNISVSPREGFFGDTILLTANLSDDERNILPNKTIGFKVGNVSVGSNLTNKSGTAIMWWNISLISRNLCENYTLSATFDGNGYYKISSANATFILKSAKWLKTSVLSDLSGINPADKSIAKEVAGVIKDVNASLASSQWTDSSHLDSKKGTIVFTKEHDAVVTMFYKARIYEILIPIYSSIINSKACSASCSRNMKPQLESMKLALPVYRESLTELVKADELLAEVSLFEAQSCPKTPAKAKQASKFIVSAQSSLKQALKDAKNRPDQAIMEFRDSWENSMKAKSFC